MTNGGLQNVGVVVVASTSLTVPWTLSAGVSGALSRRLRRFNSRWVAGLSPPVPVGMGSPSFVDRSDGPDVVVSPSPPHPAKAATTIATASLSRNLPLLPSSRRNSISLITFAGTPAAIIRGGRSWVTTELAPITQRSPI